MGRHRCTHEEFVAKAVVVHGDRYTYPEPYQGHSADIVIICPEHGVFTKKADNHLLGQGCPKCTKLLFLAQRRGFTAEEYKKILDSDTRYCKVHGVQSLREYYIHEYDGRTLYQCKECVKKTVISNPNYLSEQSKAKARDVSRVIRQEVLEHYSNGKMCCAICGESHYEFLVLDHINGGGSKHRREQQGRCYWRNFKKSGWPDGFRILCHNCNMSRGCYGYSPYERERESDSMSAEELLRSMGLTVSEEGTHHKRRSVCQGV